MPLFDTYLMVDWSAAKRPKRGADSIWWAEVARRPDGPALVARSNPATRQEAATELATRLDALSRDGRRTLVGFDFPFGYPRGTAKRLSRTRGPARHPSRQPAWRRMWRTLSDEVEDGDDNGNSRFDLAERLNQRLSGEAFPFWGHDGRRERPLLRARGRRPHGPGDLAERRLCEHRIRTTQPVWKLAYTGAVGSQALLGIPRVQALRADRRLRRAARIWPFETGLAAPEVADGGIVLAEVYPSLIAHKPEDGLVKDACQVRSIAEHFAVLDARDELAPLFAGDPDLTAEERRSIEQEEAWILGVTAAPDRKAARDHGPGAAPGKIGAGPGCAL